MHRKRWNPTIVLPQGLIADLTEDQLRHVFLHELSGAVSIGAFSGVLKRGV